MNNWKYILLSVILFPLLGMVSSCSEDDSTTDEFANWQERNTATTEQWAANSSLKKIRVYTQDEATAGRISDYIYVQVLETGDGTESPLYTDTVRVA